MAPVPAVAAGPPFSRAATQACLLSLPDGVSGLPPATPPHPQLLFVSAPGGKDIATWTPPLPTRALQLGTWRGADTIVLTFFGTADDARASYKSITWLGGGKLVGNVVASWDEKVAPRAALRDAVFGCLRSGVDALPQRPAPAATLATFGGGWGGHTRGLAISASGRGSEEASDGCCRPVYRMSFRILSVSGTITHATAVYRVTSFARFETYEKKRRVGELGKLQLRNGIVTNTLTDDYFCSDPAWGATGACGA